MVTYASILYDIAIDLRVDQEAIQDDIRTILAIFGVATHFWLH